MTEKITVWPCKGALHGSTGNFLMKVSLQTVKYPHSPLIEFALQQILSILQYTIDFLPYGNVLPFMFLRH
jgi:hypothetical protein